MSVGAVISPGLALADVFGANGPDSGLRHDGGDHTFCYESTATARMQQAARDGMNNLDAQAVIADSGPLNCGTATDIRFGSTDIANVDGFWQCTQQISGGRSASAVVRFNAVNITSDNDWKQTSCHEIGHSVGLTHNTRPDCVAGDENQLQYDQHHIDHINSQN